MTVYKTNFDRRKQRARRKLKAVSGGALRLSVYKSNSHIYAQIIDDKLGTTLVSASTLDKDVIAALGKKVANVKAAEIVGQTLGKKAVTVRSARKRSFGSPIIWANLRPPCDERCGFLHPIASTIENFRIEISPAVTSGNCPCRSSPHLAPKTAAERRTMRRPADGQGFELCDLTADLRAVSRSAC